MNFKHEIDNLNKLRGAMIFEFFNPGIPLILKNAGCEFIIFDMEHGGLSFEQFKNIYLDGLWQSENYFKNFRTEILNLYNFEKIDKKKKNIEFIKKIDLSKSICLNVRRTDFLNNSEHNVVNTKYYINAINRFKEIIGTKFKVYIFLKKLKNK